MNHNTLNFEENKQSVFVKLFKDINQDIYFEVSKIKFTSKPKEIKDFIELMEDKNQIFINYKEYEYNSYSNDFQIYTKKYKLDKQRDDINTHIVWQLESSGFEINKPLLYKNGEPIIISNKEINFLDFIEITDNDYLLKYAIQNSEISSKIDFHKVEFKDNNEKCNEILNEFKDIKVDLSTNLL